MVFNLEAQSIANAQRNLFFSNFIGESAYFSNKLSRKNISLDGYFKAEINLKENNFIREDDVQVKNSFLISKNNFKIDLYNKNLVSFELIDKNLKKHYC